MSKLKIALWILCVAINVQSSPFSDLQASIQFSPGRQTLEGFLESFKESPIKTLSRASRFVDHGVDRANSTLEILMDFIQSGIQLSRIGLLLIDDIDGAAESLNDEIEDLTEDVRGLMGRESSGENECNTVLHRYVDHAAEITFNATTCVRNVNDKMNSNFEKARSGIRQVMSSLSGITSKFRTCAPYPMAYAACAKSIYGMLSTGIIAIWNSTWTDIKNTVSGVVNFWNKMRECGSSSTIRNLMIEMFQSRNRILYETKKCMELSAPGEADEDSSENYLT